MRVTRVNFCLIGSSSLARTLTEELVALTASLNTESIITEGEPDTSCDRVMYVVFDESDSSSRLEELVAFKQDYFRDYLSESYNTDSDKPKKSNPSFLGKKYLVSEKDFFYRVRYFVLDFHNRGPPNSKRPLQYAESWRAFFYLNIIPKTKVRTSIQLQSVQQQFELKCEQNLFYDLHCDEVQESNLKARCR
jgi:hypothetical protein